MITASHNPPEDNGYKLYARDGAQIIPPTTNRRASRSGAAGDWESLSVGTSSWPQSCWTSTGALPRAISRRRGSDLGITYTPLHGVGGETMMKLLPSGLSPRDAVASSSGRGRSDVGVSQPEEPGAFDLAIATADEAGSTLIIANDPTPIVWAARERRRRWRVLRGDEIGWLLASSLLDEINVARGRRTTLVSSRCSKRWRGRKVYLAPPP